jgi:hypothetical protein
MKSEVIYQERSKPGIFVRRMLVSGSMMLAGQILRQGLELIYMQSRGEDPPKNPQAKNVGWTRAIAWSMATGALLAAAKTVIRPTIRTGIDKLMGKMD